MRKTVYVVSLLMGIGFAPIACKNKSKAICVLEPTKGYNVQGTLNLEAHDNDVQITGKITGLTPGTHGFHIHEFGDLSDPEGKSAGDHYNPQNHPHGSPDSSQHHSGDLGNIEANAQGIAEVNTKASGVTLDAIVGRSIIVHGDKDDLQSQPSGNAGARAAVGIISTDKST